MRKVFVGYDSREQRAYDVAVNSLKRNSRQSLSITPINSETLQRQGLLRRPVDARGGLYDIPSQAPQSTQFAISRFLTPILAQDGLALFMDCDVVVLDDIMKLFDLAQSKYAVQVVKHEHKPPPGIKMDGAIQTAYARKNWSSVMLFNCKHPANKRLTLDAVNHWPGRDLHAFAWLHDDEIGELPMEWNWLVGVQPKPEKPCIAHFTLGGPWFDDWAPAEHDEIWLQEAELL